MPVHYATNRTPSNRTQSIGYANQQFRNSGAYKTAVKNAYNNATAGNQQTVVKVA